MKSYRVLPIAISIAALVGAAEPPAEAPVALPPPRNLKVLAPDTSAAVVDDVMKRLNRAIGVECEFCHVKGDWVTDDHPVKIKTQRAMQDLKDWNEKHNPGSEPKLTCWKCHRGKLVPDYAPVLRGDPASLRFMMDIAGAEDMSFSEGVELLLRKGKHSPPAAPSPSGVPPAQAVPADAHASFASTGAEASR